MNDPRFDEHVEQALAIASSPGDGAVIARHTRLARFDRIGIAPARKVPADQATVVSSTTDGRGWRYPVIDLDCLHTYVPSDTPGHGHLYLDRRMHYGRVLALMTGLWAAGIIERGHWIGHLFRGYSAVRLPWVRKHARVRAAGRERHGDQHRGDASPDR